MVTTILAIIIFVCYLVMVSLKKRTIPDSISETSYLTEKPYLFTAFMWALALLVLSSLLGKAEGISRFYSVVMCFGLVGVGCTPLYRTEGRLMHYACAILSGIMSQCIIFNSCDILLLEWIPYILYFIFRRDDNWLFWMQVSCMVTISTYCLT